MRIEARQIHFRENIGKWIGAADQIAVSLQIERGVQFGRAGYHQFRGRPRGQTRARVSQRLARTAVRAKNVIGGDATPAETAEDYGHRQCLAAELLSRRAITDLARSQLS